MGENNKKNDISKFSNSLTDFLINAMSDKHLSERQIAQRLNNLKVFMDPLKLMDPHFFVSIGISEACYSIETGKKIDGSLGPEDSYVSRWASRTNINTALQTHWKSLMKDIELDAEEDATKRAIDAIKMMDDDEEDENNDDLHVDMTGSGVGRKHANRGKRRYYYKGEMLDLTPEEFEKLQQGEDLIVDIDSFFEEN